MAINKLSNYKADWSDIALIKISVFSASLLAAKYWALLLSLEWYWYVIILIISAIKPLKTFIVWMKS